MHNFGSVVRNFGSVARNFDSAVNSFGSVVGNFDFAVRSFGSVAYSFGSAAQSFGSVVTVVGVSSEWRMLKLVLGTCRSFAAGQLADMLRMVSGWMMRMLFLIGSKVALVDRSFSLVDGGLIFRELRPPVEV